LAEDQPRFGRAMRNSKLAPRARNRTEAGACPRFSSKRRGMAAGWARAGWEGAAEAIRVAAMKATKEIPKPKSGKRNKSPNRGA